MGCPRENTWVGYLGGSLEDRSVEEIEAHLDGCPTCQLVFADLARQDAASAVTAPAVGPLPPPLGGDSLDRPPGTRVGRYVLLGVLGRGGMGVVYKAFDPELDRPIALKLVGLAGLGRRADESRARLAREARTLAQLSHPNVVAVHDVGSYDGDLFVAMEFVAGQTLRAWLATPRAPREVLRVYRAAGEGLHAAHTLGVVHRDFKPDNVMIGDDGRVRVLDFGLARPPDRREGPAPAELPLDLTADGVVMGTPAYMAPEQDQGREVDARSDQFSFCVALYEALYRRPPFVGSTYLALVEARATGALVAPGRRRGVSARVRRALLTGLATEPAARHADLAPILAALRRRTSSGWLVAAVLAVVAVAIGGWSWWSATRPSPTMAAACAGVADELREEWNPASRAALVATFEKSGHPRGAAIAAGFAERVDRWAAGWTRARTELCQLAMRRDEDSESKIPQRVACLERRLSEVTARVYFFTELADPSSVAAAEQYRPRSPGDCDQLAAPQLSGVQRAVGGTVMRQALAAQGALARGELEPALLKARAAVGAARATGSDILTYALTTLARVHVERAEYDAARPLLRDAVLAATEAREEGLAADAWLLRIGIAAIDTRADPGLDEALFAARLTVARLRPDDGRRAALTSGIATVDLMRGRLAEAEAGFHRAIEMWRADPDRDHRLELLEPHNGLGFLHMYRGEWAEAERYFAGMLATLREMFPRHANVGVVLGNRATIRWMRRDHAGAVREFWLAVAHQLSASGGNDAMRGLALSGLGLAYASWGRCAAAEPLLARSRALVLPLQGARSSMVGYLDLGDGLCLLQRGDAAGAVAALERGVAAAAARPMALFQVPFTAAWLARARFAAGDRAARAAARAARAELATIPGMRAHVEELDAWLRQAENAETAASARPAAAPVQLR